MASNPLGNLHAIMVLGKHLVSNRRRSRKSSSESADRGLVAQQYLWTRSSACFEEQCPGRGYSFVAPDCCKSFLPWLATERHIGPQLVTSKRERALCPRDRLFLFHLFVESHRWGQGRRNHMLVLMYSSSEALGMECDGQLTSRWRPVQAAGQSRRGCWPHSCR